MVALLLWTLSGCIFLIHFKDDEFFWTLLRATELSWERDWSSEKLIIPGALAWSGESESKCENATAARGTAEEESEEGRGVGPVSDDSSAPFALDAHGSPEEDNSSPVEDSIDRLDPG